MRSSVRLACCSLLLLLHSYLASLLLVKARGVLKHPKHHAKYTPGLSIIWGCKGIFLKTPEECLVAANSLLMLNFQIQWLAFLHTKLCQLIRQEQSCQLLPCKCLESRPKLLGKFVLNALVWQSSPNVSSHQKTPLNVRGDARSTQFTAIFPINELLSFIRPQGIY